MACFEAFQQFVGGKDVLCAMRVGCRRESVLAGCQQFRVALRCEVLCRKRFARPFLNFVSRQVDAQHRKAVFGEGRKFVADSLVERV